MKKLLLIIAFFAIAEISAIAQEKTGTKAQVSTQEFGKRDGKGKQKGKNARLNQSDTTSMNCLNAKGECRMKDKFIDADGDGINDNRCNGMGLGLKKGQGKGKCCGKID